MLRSTVTSLSDPIMMRYYDKVTYAQKSLSRIDKEISDLRLMLEDCGREKIDVIKRKIEDREAYKNDIYRFLNRISARKPVYVPRLR